MTNVPPEPKPNDQQPPDDEGQMGFLLGPRDKPDGTPIEWTPEDIRRFKALMHHVKRLAKQHGLEPDASIEPNPASVAESERSKEVTEAANPKMVDAALNVFAGHQSRKITHPDGTEESETKSGLEIKALLNLDNAVKALASLTAPLRWSGRMCVRFGKWVKATVSASNEDAEGKA